MDQLFQIDLKTSNEREKNKEIQFIYINKMISFRYNVK